MLIFVAMEIEKHIAELLYRYDCITLPTFGAFLTQRIDAVVNKETNTFYPPSKVVSFNEQLVSNDGLLISYIAEVENTSFEVMAKRVKEEATKWKNQLRSGQPLSLANIGTLWLNGEGRIQFQPSTHVNYLSASFGMSSVMATPVVRETLKEEVAILEEKTPFIITPETRSLGNFRPLFKYAAIFLIAATTAVTGYQFYSKAQLNTSLAQEEAQQQVTRKIQEATFFSTTPIELPTLNITVTKEVSTPYHIVAGAFRFKENAAKKVAELTKKGFNAAYLGTNDHGLHQVTYNSFADADEALLFLRKVKAEQDSAAWMLVKK